MGSALKSWAVIIIKTLQINEGRSHNYNSLISFITKLQCIILCENHIILELNNC